MKPQIVTHVHQPLNFTVFDIKWVPSSCRFVVLGNLAKGYGVIHVYELDGADVKLQKSLEREKSFKCGTFGATTLQDRHLATGNFAGQVEIWDLESFQEPVYSVKGHETIINCIDGVGGLGRGHGAPELVTGSRDGVVRVWDPRQKDSVANIEPEKGTEGRDCWTVAFGNSFNDDSRAVSAGYDNGDIKLFDLRAMKAQWEINVGSGVCCIEFDRKDIEMNKLVAVTVDSKFHVYDLRTQHAIDGFAALSQTTQKGTIWTVKHLPQDRDVFVTTGGNGSVSLWKYLYPERRRNGDMGVVGSVDLLRESSVATQPVSAFDWNADHRGLAVCSSFDQSIRVLVTTKLNIT